MRGLRWTSALASPRSGEVGGSCLPTQWGGRPARAASTPGGESQSSKRLGKGSGGGSGGRVGLLCGAVSQIYLPTLDTEHIFVTLQTCVLKVGQGEVGPHKRPSNRSIRYSM